MRQFDLNNPKKLSLDILKNNQLQNQLSNSQRQMKKEQGVIIDKRHRGDDNWSKSRLDYTDIPSQQKKNIKSARTSSSKPESISYRGQG